MSGWQIFAWVFMAGIAVLRVAMIVGVVVVIVAIARGLRAMTAPVPTQTS
jgi:hypothetical protein